MSEGKMIVASYRLPYRLSVHSGRLKIIPSAGGLATALHSYFQHEKMQKVRFKSFHWVGVSDLGRKSFERVSSSPTIEDNGLVLHPVFMRGHESEAFYNGFCNSVLWPLFHYFPSYVIHEQQFFEAYQRANELMAEKITGLYEAGDLIWIHDYHFMLLPALLRKNIPSADIRFFLHIPFPAFELLRILPKPWRLSILHGLLGSNVIGFHTDDYVHHFLDSIYRMLGLEVKENFVLAYDGRDVLVRSYPISIDFEKFQDAASLPAVKQEVKRIQKRFGSSKLILSVDRLDYTKAIINRLESFELFLQQYPKYRERVTYILLVVPSRDGILKYRENKREIETLISKINGMYSSITWTPVIYQYRTLDFRKLVALYNACEIALITPVRDGMNLVAKEYVASRTDRTGVLILSETAGSAAELTEAILVNPNDRHELASTISQALLQPSDEQARRMSVMQQYLRSHNVYDWVGSIIDQHLKENLEMLKD